MKSSEWKAFRIKWFNKYQVTTCKMCGEQSPLQLHHKTYKRLGREKDTDLVAVCEPCHKLIHKWKINLNIDRKTEKQNQKAAIRLLKKEKRKEEAENRKLARSLRKKLRQSPSKSERNEARWIASLPGQSLRTLHKKKESLASDCDSQSIKYLALVEKEIYRRKKEKF